MPALVVHTRYWAIAIGPQADQHREALDSAVRVAATRYRLGDGFTARDVDETAAMRRHAGGASVIAAIQESRGDIAGVPGFALDVASPTTVGLGDSFVGGFLSVCRREGARS